MPSDNFQARLYVSGKAPGQVRLWIGPHPDSEEEIDCPPWEAWYENMHHFLPGGWNWWRLQQLPSELGPPPANLPTCACSKARLSFGLESPCEWPENIPEFYRVSIPGLASKWRRWAFAQDFGTEVCPDFYGPFADEVMRDHAAVLQLKFGALTGFFPENPFTVTNNAPYNYSYSENEELCATHTRFVGWTIYAGIGATCHADGLLLGNYTHNGSYAFYVIGGRQDDRPLGFPAFDHSDTFAATAALLAGTDPVTPTELREGFTRPISLLLYFRAGGSGVVRFNAMYQPAELRFDPVA